MRDELLDSLLEGIEHNPSYKSDFFNLLIGDNFKRFSPFYRFYMWIVRQNQKYFPTLNSNQLYRLVRNTFVLYGIGHYKDNLWVSQQMFKISNYNTTHYLWRKYIYNSKNKKIFRRLVYNVLLGRVLYLGHYQVYGVPLKSNEEFTKEKILHIFNEASNLPDMYRIARRTVRYLITAKTYRNITHGFIWGAFDKVLKLGSKNYKELQKHKIFIPYQFYTHKYKKHYRSVGKLIRRLDGVTVDLTHPNDVVKLQYSRKRTIKPVVLFYRFAGNRRFNVQWYVDTATIRPAFFLASETFYNTASIYIESPFYSCNTIIYALKKASSLATNITVKLLRQLVSFLIKTLSKKAGTSPSICNLENKLGDVKPEYVITNKIETKQEAYVSPFVNNILIVKNATKVQANTKTSGFESDIALIDDTDFDLFFNDDDDDEIEELIEDDIESELCFDDDFDDDFFDDDIL